MHKSTDQDEVLWLLEGDAWVGVFADECPDAGAGICELDGFMVEVLLRAEDWHVEVSHPATGSFAREHVEAVDVEQVKARAVELLRSFRTRNQAAGGRAS